MSKIKSSSKKVLEQKKEILNKYNWKVSANTLIESNISKVWDIISTESNLELFHPFCRKNRSINWPGRDSVDEIEYLNGLTYIRKFTKWEQNNGYDLYNGQKKGPLSFVRWRLSSDGDKCDINITVYPYLFNIGSKLVNILPFWLIIRPMLISYLNSVVKGLKFYAETNKIVKPNHFGRHRWFS